MLKMLLRITARYNARTFNIANWNIGSDAVVWTRKNNLEQESRFFKIARYLSVCVVMMRENWTSGKWLGFNFYYL